MENFQFKIGDTVLSLVNVNFMDGSKYVRGKEYVIKSDELSYYQVNEKDYAFVESK